MTGTTKVSPAEVMTLSQDITTKSRDIAGFLSDLDAKVSSLKAQWDGDAKVEYERAQQAWNTSVTEMNALLSRVGGKLVDIADDYSATDKRGAARFGG